MLSLLIIDYFRVKLPRKTTPLDASNARNLVTLPNSENPLSHNVITAVKTTCLSITHPLQQNAATAQAIIPPHLLTALFAEEEYGSFGKNV